MSKVQNAIGLTFAFVGSQIITGCGSTSDKIVELLTPCTPEQKALTTVLAANPNPPKEGVQVAKTQDGKSVLLSGNIPNLPGRVTLHVQGGKYQDKYYIHRDGEGLDPREWYNCNWTSLEAFVSWKDTPIYQPSLTDETEGGAILRALKEQYTNQH